MASILQGTSMPHSFKSFKRCYSCDDDCRCGCQSNIYSLPLEILEQILEYEDPITLLSLERTCKLLFITVSRFWDTYCKRRGLYCSPTPLCIDSNTTRQSYYTYDEAVQLCNDPIQKWRIVAVRSFLCRNRQCVFCRAPCSMNNTLMLEEDVLLCSRCLPHFCITVTHDMVHFFDSVGVDINRLHINFGPMLLSNLIKILRMNNLNDVDIMERLRSYANDRNLSPLPFRSSLFMPLSLTFDTTNVPSTQQRICTLATRQQACCCAVTSCSSTRTHDSRSLMPSRVSVNPSRSRSFYAMMLVIFFFNFVEVVFSMVVVKSYQLVSKGSENFASFLWTAIIDIILIFGFTVYVIVNWIRRMKKNSWNKSFASILQCILLACLLTEIFHVILIALYTKNITKSTKEIFVTGTQLFTKDEVYRNQINWIQTHFECCGFSGNATQDWLFFNSSTATLSLPASCCGLVIGYNNCNATESRFFTRSCVVAVNDVLSSLLNAYKWTSVFCCVVHFLYLLYACQIFRLFRSSQRDYGSSSVETIFTIF